MGRNLKESLAIIRARANALRHRREAPELVDDLVDSGAVTKGPPNERVAAGPSTDRKAAPSADDARESYSASNALRADAVDLKAAIERYKTGDPGPIEAIEPGSVRSIGGDSFYLVRPVGESIDPAAPREADAFARLCAWPEHVSPVARGARGKAAPPFDKESVCYLDIETTGLSPTTYMFLCGLMFWRGGKLVVEQVFARNYAEEAAVLRYVREVLSGFETVVTYNGEKFDLPFIRTRMAANRVEPLKPVASVDLLYTARRVFRGVLPNCRLGTVERHIRGIERTGDIPGAHIPVAYHDYVRTGDGRAMKNVLYHNRMDLFTMVVLVNRLAAREYPT
jgi:uncharacterized protein YprB with RNaseH-like and TPR domain